MKSVKNTTYFPVLCPWYHRRVLVVSENVLLQTVFSEPKHRCPIPMHHRTFPVSDWTLPIYYWTQSFLWCLSLWNNDPFRWSLIVLILLNFFTSFHPSFFILMSWTWCMTSMIFNSTLWSSSRCWSLDLHVVFICPSHPCIQISKPP
jgi:hypothetical protein